MVRRVVEFVIAFTGTAVVILILLLVVRPALRGSDASPRSGQPEASITLELRAEADIEEFLAMFAASRRGTYLLTGQLEHEPVGGGEATVQPVRIARRGDTALEQFGPSLRVIVDGQEQSCEQLANAPVTCGPITPSPSAAEETEAIRTLLVGDEPHYVLYQDDPGCRLMVRSATGPVTPWGQTTLLCFDAGTGAVNHQVTTGIGGVRTLRVDTLSATVADEDLIPPN